MKIELERQRMLPTARVAFAYPYDLGGRPMAAFVCSRTGAALLWEEARQCWVDDDGKRALTPYEAEMVVSASMRALKQLQHDVHRKKGGEWFFARWWRRLLGRA